MHQPKLPPQLRPPARFVDAALCVHSGWHYTSRRPIPPRDPDYLLFGHGFWRTWDVPDRIAGGSGEGGWGEVDGSYGGGLQFTLGTYNRAAALSRRMVPFAASTSAIAAQSPAVQILAAYLIVSEDRSWREWPQTSRACDLE